MSNVFALPIATPEPPPRSEPFYGSGQRMLTLPQLCEWLNITERHVRKLVERDAIPYRKVGALLRFYEPDVEAWTRPAPRQSEPEVVVHPTPVHRPVSRARIARRIPITLAD